MSHTDPMMDCDDPSHEWLVHLRSDYIVEVHAATKEMAEEVALERADNGEYEMGKTAEAVDVWPNQFEQNCLLCGGTCEKPDRHWRSDFGWPEAT